MAQTRASRGRSARDAEALAEILPRAANPAERARGGWIEPGNDSRVEERLEAWAGSAVGGSVDDLERLLVRRGVETAALRRMLCDARPASSPDGSPRPAWAEVVTRLVAAGRRAASAPPPIRAADMVELGDLPAEAPADARWRFEAVSAPWIGAADELLGRTAAQTGLRLSARARGGLLAGLAQRWHEVLIRLLLEPFGPADAIRSVPPRIGDTVEAAYFGEAAAVDDWLRLWIAYPVAARLMALSFERWHANVRELFARLARDESRLAAAFGRGAGRLGDLRSARWAGDPHEGHRRVVLLGFASGVEVAYKPRSLDPDLWYAAAYGDLTGDRYPVCGRILARSGYGWQGLVPEADCASERALNAYFRRIGAHARVFELLDAVDAHGENLIAAGEHPTVIDMETLLSPRPVSGKTVTGLSDAEAPSPLRSALVTMKARGSRGAAAIELGALAMPRWETTPWPALAADSATDSLALGPGRFRVASALPLLGGRHVSPDAFEDDIVAGYVDADREIRKRAPGWLRNGAAAAAGRLRLRFVHRETRTYARLLTASLGAAALRDGVARELVLEVLWRGGLDDEPSTRPPALIEAEVCALRDLDIPLFRIAPATRELLIADVGLPGYFEESPLAALEGRVACLGEARRDRAADAIRTALFVRDPALRRGRAGRRQAEAGTLVERLLAAGEDSPGRAWFGLRYESAFACWSWGPLGSGLATGESGIAAVLSDISRQTGARRSAEVAAATLARAPELLEAAAEEPQPAIPLPSCSLAGAIYGLHRAASQLGVEPAPIEDVAEAKISKTVEPEAAAIWLASLSGCRIASPRLTGRLLELAWSVRERLGDFASASAPGSSLGAGRYVEMTPLAAALVGLQRLGAQVDAALAPPPELLVDVCRSEGALSSLATHAILATEGLSPGARAVLAEAVAAHRPAAHLPPLERAEHALARAWVGCEPRSVACAAVTAAIGDWQAEHRAPQRFDLGALGGLANACHLAMRTRSPRRLPPLRTCPRLGHRGR